MSIHLVLSIQAISRFPEDIFGWQILWEAPSESPWLLPLTVAGILLILLALVAWHWVQASKRVRLLEALVSQQEDQFNETRQKFEQTLEQREQAETTLSQKAEENLQKSEARFRAVYDYAEMGIVITHLDGQPVQKGVDERLFTSLVESQRFNPALQRMFGYTEEQLRKVSIVDCTYPADRSLDVDLGRELFEGRRDSYKVEKRYVRKDGSIFWGRLNYSLARNPDGTPYMAIGIIEDIDDERRARDRLRESEARFRAIYDNSDVGVAMMGLERRLIAVNAAAARLTGYSQEEMLNMNPVDIIYIDDKTLDTELFHEVTIGKRNTYTIEKRYVHKEGRIFWARVSYSLVRDDTDQPLFLVGLIEDIDAQKRADEKLAAQEAQYRHTLEQRVEERTTALSDANLRLLEEIEQRQRAEQALAQKAADEAILAERNRLARDLHDAVTQTLFSASLLAEVLPQLWEVNRKEARKRLAELRELTRGALAEMRTLLLELRPAALTDTALPDLLRQLSEAIIGRARIPIQLTIDGENRLAPEVQVALYRIAQEALNNVVKYARATQVIISLKMDSTSGRLMIVDNGTGFMPEAVPPNHLGVRIMRERAEGIGAKLTIYSEPGEGTQIAVSWQAA